MLFDASSIRAWFVHRALGIFLGLAILPSTGAAADPDEGFFFIHLSDAHVYRHSSQVAERYGLGPSWTPRVLLAHVALRDYRRALVPYYDPSLVAGIDAQAERRR